MTADHRTRPDPTLPETSPTPSMATPSRSLTWLGEPAWMDPTFPSRHRNLTPSQRRQRANELWKIRRGLREGTLVVRS